MTTNLINLPLCTGDDGLNDRSNGSFSQKPESIEHVSEHRGEELADNENR